MQRRRRRLLAAVAVLGAIGLTTGIATAPASAHPERVTQPQPGTGFGDWPTLQGDQSGSRFNPYEWRIKPATVSHLKLKWAFTHAVGGDDPVPAKSWPAVVGDSVYFGSTDAKFYSVDAHTGRTRWTFDLNSVNKVPALVLDGPTVAGNAVYFGSMGGNLYALNRWTGKLLWRTQLDTAPTALLTGSPLYHRGRIYVGISSAENTLGTDYPCCRFRGQLAAVNARTGTVDWRYYTVPKARQVGTWPSGAAHYAPSGGGVWSSPVIDRRSGTLYVGTGQNYTGNAGDFDSMLALNARTGAVRWKQKMNDADTWRSTCNGPNAEKYCPGLHNGTALDYDIGSMPNIFRVHGQTRVGVGQKSGVYHVFDARTGRIIWQRQLSEPFPSGGISGIQWGGSYDGKRLYVSTYYADPGTLWALDPATGKTIWRTPNPANGCSTGGAATVPTCAMAGQTAVTTSPGVVYEGSTDGKIRAYSAASGRVLWTFDTVHDFRGVNGPIGHGGQISGGGGPVVAHGMLYIQSGYPGFPSDKGYVLLAFGL